MKRHGNLYENIISIDNLYLADEKASKGKGKQPGVKEHLKNRDANIWALHQQLYNKTFTTSVYTTFTVYEPKERLIFRLPYFPDRILHHAIMNVLEPIFVGMFTANTYSCIKGRGVHSALKDLRKALNNEAETTYCLKLDIKKFYPSINHDILKALLRRKIKDVDLLLLLDEIIDSADGLPIGNYLSQFLANFYLTYFDHWLKEIKCIKYYFRYCDDIVILHSNKGYLHTLLAQIKEYLNDNLLLQVKGNYQIFPVAARGIDVLGYVTWHTHTLLRKSIKQNFARMMAKNKNQQSFAAYYGWAKHANTNHLFKKLLK